ncbi:MAG: uracil-DNA glycosylase [Gemmatimonadetes bacterium]|nr:uracil-DNA glycosylase [Gemmatimonadota bacterium]MYI05910.1 uracil-DNA glycosylase [Gemmatimonadota bacterium]
MSARVTRDPGTRLAEYLDQRRRIGEPAILPSGLEPGEMMTLLRKRGAVGAGAAQAAHPAVAAAAPEFASADYDRLRNLALACTRCALAEGRRQVVFSDGNPEARLMVVGEAPGAREDATGLPFVGQAGKLLDLMLAAVGLSREDSVYICNVLKCRPPGNRDPLPGEIESCAPILKRQIELVAPEVLLAVGSFAAQWLTSTTGPLGKLRGKVYSYQGVPLVVTYHPAALLRNPGLNRLCWSDLQLLRQVMDGA